MSVPARRHGAKASVAKAAPTPTTPAKSGSARRPAVETKGRVVAGASSRDLPAKKTSGRAASKATATGTTSARAASPSIDAGTGTAIQRCVREELKRHFVLLDGEPPSDLYRKVMQQVEASLLDAVLRECGGNRSRAAAWLGISRGTLRGKLADLDAD